MEETLNATVERSGNEWEVVVEVDRFGDVEPFHIASGASREEAIANARMELTAVVTGENPLRIIDVRDDDNVVEAEPPYDHPIVAMLSNGTEIACGWVVGQSKTKAMTEAKLYAQTWLDAVNTLQ